MPGRFRVLRTTLGLLVATVSLGILGWGVWPGDLTTDSLAIPDGGQLILSWPAILRKGDSQLIRLEIDPGGAEGLGTGGAQIGEVESLEDSAAGVAPSNLLAAARLEFNNLLYTPAEMVSQPLRAGKPVAFHWQVRPEGRGVYQGVAWLYVFSVPFDGGSETSQPISAKQIEIRAVDFFGLSGPTARILGGMGLLGGALLTLEGAWAWLSSRRNPQERRLEPYSIER